MKPLAAILALTLFSTSAFAEGYFQSPNELNLVRKVFVSIDDQVTDGCLPNPGALKVEAELIFRRSGITVLDEPEFAPPNDYALDLFALGWAHGQQCMAMLTLALYRWMRMESGKYYARVHAYDDSILLSGPKHGMQDQLRAQVSTAISDLANEILKARGN
jgi:hypothetical protein